MLVTRGMASLFKDNGIKDCFIHLCKTFDDVPELSVEQKALLNIPPLPKRVANKREVGKTFEFREPPMPARIMMRRSTMAVAQHEWQPVQQNDEMDIIEENMVPDLNVVNIEINPIVNVQHAQHDSHQAQPNNGIVEIGEDVNNGIHAISHDENMATDAEMGDHTEGMARQFNVAEIVQHGPANAEIIDTAPALTSTTKITQEPTVTPIEETASMCMNELMSVDGEIVNASFGGGHVASETEVEENEVRQNDSQFTEAIPSAINQGSSIMKVPGSASKNKKRRVSFAEESTVHEYDVNDETSDQNKENESPARQFDSVGLQEPNDAPGDESVSAQENLLKPAKIQKRRSSIFVEQHDQSQEVDELTEPNNEVFNTGEGSVRDGEVVPFDSVTLMGPNNVPINEFVSVQKNYLANIVGEDFNYDD